jgi:hypothetical protein
MADKEASTYGGTRIFSKWQTRKRFDLTLFIFSIYIKISHELPINHMKQSIAESLADNTAL